MKEINLKNVTCFTDFSIIFVLDNNSVADVDLELLIKINDNFSKTVLHYWCTIDYYISEA